MRESGLDRAVLLAQDAVYDRAGRRDEARTHVYVPNQYLFRVVAQYPDLFIACPSINPDRADCLEELAKSKAKGARILKIHPPIQGVDIADPKHTEFFRRCAALDIIVMVHTGHEHAAPVIDINLADPRKLELALDQGCTVVACHCGSGWRGEQPDFLAPFLEMLGRYERLYGDTSILGSTFRAHDAGRLLAHPEVLPRLLHGSDYPFPSAPWAFWHRLGLVEAGRIAGEQNLLKRDLMLKDALGFGRASAERAHTLLR
jgi:predicted TIM-barrel fold metal-dependent hydrolase